MEKEIKLASFEKKGVNVDVVLKIIGLHNDRLVLRTGGEEIYVHGIRYVSGRYGYEVFTDAAKKVWPIPSGKSMTIVTDESAKEIEKRVKNEVEKFNREYLDGLFAKLTDDSPIELHWGTNYRSVVGKIGYHEYFKNGIQTLVKSESEIEDLLGRKADEVDVGDYSITHKYKMTFAEFKQIVEKAKEIVAELDAKKAEKQRKRQEEIAAKFEEAKRTGKPVELKRWTEPCNDPHLECDIDILVEFAMPDGSRKIQRSHTF